MGGGGIRVGGNPMGSGNQPIRVDGYKIVRPIGRGASSQVFEAKQRRFDRDVALKVLHIGITDDDERLAFENECEAMGPVSEHPNIVTVYEGGLTADGHPYLAMELCADTLLDRVQERGSLGIETVLDIGVHMCAALQRSHDRGILHRDIKPQNIFFTRYGAPVLGDFGIASVGYGTQIRVDGMTLHYAAPEIVDDEPPSVASDLYSLGATLYTALAGRRPFHRPGETVDMPTIQHRILYETPPVIDPGRVPGPVDHLVRGLLAKARRDRPQSALEFGGMLRDLQSQLGLPQTPLAVADTANDPTVGRTQQSTRPPGQDDQTGQTSQQPNDQEQPQRHPQHPQHPPAGPAQVPAGAHREVGHRRDHLASLPTVSRGQQSSRLPWADTDRLTSRSLLGAAALVGVVLALAIGAVLSLAREDDDGNDSSSDNRASGTTGGPAGPVTTEPPVAQAVVQEAPEQPENVVVRPVGNRLVVSWDPVEGADEYLVERLDADSARTATDPSIEYSADSGPVCVSVRAVGPTGRRSEASPTTCSD